MAQNIWQRTEDFTPGFLHKRDVTQMPSGALILGSKNVVITDGDRVGVRKGSELFGASSTATTPITGLHTFKTRAGTNLMMRAYGTNLEYYHRDDATWVNLNDGYTSGKVFGFADHNVNTDAVDYVYFSNGVEPLSRWTGAIDKLDGALAGGETEVDIQGSIFTDNVFYSGTASSVTTTTVTIAASKWATNLWNDNFYVRITSGASSGKVSKISATTATQITFTAISGLSGTPTFEIRKLAFDENNQKLRIGTTDVTYTGYGSDTQFTGCSNVPAASDGDPVTQAIEELIHENTPRGNILKVLNTRMFLAGNPANPQALYYSKIEDASDWSFSSPRIASEGGIADMPEGGGGINGIGIQEEDVHVLKEDIIKTVSFTQGLAGDGANFDMVQIDPLIDSPRAGAVFSKGVFKIDNQLFYVSPEGGIKSVTRVPEIDFAQSLQLSDSIKSLVEDFVFTSSCGIFYKQKAYIACKLSSNSVGNDVVLVYNFQVRKTDGTLGAWEAPIYGWNVSGWTIYDDELYFGHSLNPEVYKAETSHDDNGLAYDCVARFAYSNYGAPENPKSHQTIFLEGYIGESTTITIKERYNYIGSQETRETTLTGADSDYIVANPADNVLGQMELGSEPLGGLDTEDDENPNDLQKFRVYLQTPENPWYEVSLEVSSNEAGSQWEILRFAREAKLLSEPVTKLRKKLA